MLASLSHDTTKIPRKQVADWTKTKISTSRLPIRSQKQLTLINNLDKDVHDLELQEYQVAQKVPSC